MDDIRDMSLTVFRRHMRTRVLAALLAVVVCGATVNWGHAGGDDPGCDLTLAVPGQQAPHLATQASAPATDHCPLCHFLRLLQVAISAKPLAAVGVFRTALCLPSGGAAVVQLFAFNVSSRAPPASHL